jgi:predicted kinase
MKRTLFCGGIQDNFGSRSEEVWQRVIVLAQSIVAANDSLLPHLLTSGKLKNMKKPKLIFLNGFAASGKSTLTAKYLSEHKFALGFEGDVLIGMFGQWRADWEGAAELKLLHTKNIVRTHLEAGFDVVLPFLLTAKEQVQEYEKMAMELDVDFYEIFLDLEKEEAVTRLLKRGVWGEEGSPQLTKKDLPEIEDLYQRMETATATRKNTTFIKPNWNQIEQTYQDLLQVID